MTPHPLSTSAQGLKVVTNETGPDGKRHAVCTDTAGSAPWTVQSGPTVAECSTRNAYLRRVAQHQTNSLSDVTFAFPFLVEAVDPAAEAKLAGLKGAMTSGGYLFSSALKQRQFGQFSALQVPVLVASQPATHVAVSYHLVQLPAAAATAVAKGAPMSRFGTTAGNVVRVGAADQSLAYRSLLAAMATPTSHGDYFADELSYLYTTGPTRYQVSGAAGGRALTARTVKNDRGVWANPMASDAIGTLIPAGGDDTALRSMSGYQWNNQNPRRLGPPAFVKEGTFDASKLPGYSALSRVPLGTYASIVLTGATAKDRRVIDDRSLSPSPNITGYTQPAPLMITTLSALPAFEQHTASWGKLAGDTTSAPLAPVNARAPISSIRIRVAGVSGIDPTSRERVRLVAQQIQQKTGLLVDVTVGSSPAPQTIFLPAGEHGRPQLTLTENWVKKGVAVAILTAVDKKSLALFVLVLVVCGLFVANTVAASVRSRRTELGVLACLGWPKSRLFALVATELTLVALAAGIGGALLAWGAGAALGIPVSIARAALAVPASLVVALVAGAVPAWAAAQAPPLEAVRPTASTPKRATGPRSVTALARVNVSRTRARSTLAAAGLVVAVAALTVIVGIITAFRGAVVGTLLGNAVTVQVRGADKAAVAAIMILAGGGVANVLFLGIRERGPEIATLQAIGWTEAALTRLLVTEGLIIGLVGALVGAAGGLSILAAFLGPPTAAMVWATLAVFAVGVVVTALATLPPILAIRRLPTATLLTEE